ncbi:MAG: hypothetical protein Hyperionvirus11_24 [Hyperionvirus sp.]|uniref:Uncharacterized protein n=1 Tax=Hyperionvirus sp. TaxID=2487770 RepID=A0A3G5ABR9_9VIRU|nr:MAG: hypothetical protein Hyperionvirus11_24 [Hyperionvirus sp.]
MADSEKILAWVKSISFSGRFLNNNRFSLLLNRKKYILDIVEWICLPFGSK